jgi:hypothetical protein
MATGIKIYNDSGAVQIDETYRNVCLISKQSISLSHSGGIVYVNVSTSGPRALVCVESANYIPLLANVTFDGTSWVWRWGFGKNGGAFTSDTAYAWIFDYLTTPPSDTVGVKVFNAAGEMVYHSASKPLRIITTLPHNSGYTGTSGRKYLPLIMANAYYTETLFPNTTGYSLGLLSSANVITPTPMPLSPAVATSANYGQYAVVDVTHY